MNNKPEISLEEFEEIERFILGEISSEEKGAFEERIITNQELRREVNFQRSLQATIEVDSWIKNKENSKVSRKLISFLKYGIAASVVFILGLFIWLQPWNSESSSGDIYTAYFYPDPGLPVPMSSTDSYQFDDGMVSYKEEKYQEAQDIWTNLAQDQPTDTLAFYLAMAKLNQKEFESSAQFLDQLLEDSNSEFYQKALWYRSLIYLKEEEKESAIQLLEKLNSPLYKKEELLEKLK
ncbi:tetratricopeptide repeat protein [Algoriphagus zhangzhouensis]|uniref:Tetratricopeptide repeat-containing protein n=1 Tax=Algoriphagus zhangzhouensis TaxID=1073327 RepID=A0A1M7Z548_9BACT|nr:hypothetical protein [Algoriphagus zhangzhouensis]TDY48861.1 hypothetical protein A8938_0550 [Algoriphagus zhangzhouensis]SHO60068.1 hypothetical protein SAMN04488108_0550 [Algoriphagus zhangzhouensis]